MREARLRIVSESEGRRGREAEGTTGGAPDGYDPRKAVWTRRPLLLAIAVVVIITGPLLVTLTRDSATSESPLVQPPAAPIVTETMRGVSDTRDARGVVTLAAGRGGLTLGSQVEVSAGRYGLVLRRGRKTLLLAGVYPGRLTLEVKLPPRRLLAYRWIEVVRLNRRTGREPRTITVLRTRTQPLLERLLRARR